MAVGDQLGSGVDNPSQGEQNQARTVTVEIKEEVTDVKGYRRNSTGLAVGLEHGEQCAGVTGASHVLTLEGWRRHSLR